MTTIEEDIPKLMPGPESESDTEQEDAFLPC